ncbi:MAG TPA: hypothetical protein GXX18_05660 [Bacillales bacterium]|nr:hypothetical protein [Bacillales bacterium]
MGKELFIQHSHESSIRSIGLKNSDYNSIDIGINLNDFKFLSLFLNKLSKYPYLFAIDSSLIIEAFKSNLKKNNINYREANNRNNWIIINVFSYEQLRVVVEYTIQSVNLGSNTFIFIGENFGESTLIPITHLFKPTEFTNIDYSNVNSIIDVSEVGISIHTKDTSINSPMKIRNYIPDGYTIDSSNSDFN